MEALLNQNLLYPFIAILALIIWNVFLHFKLRKINNRLEVFFAGKKASDLEGVLFEEIKRLKQAEVDILKLYKSSDLIKEMAERGIQKVGVVRFNPFKGTGGDQSFSIALLDSHDNGLVISALYTQEGARVYSKPITAGKSDYPLSKEEENVLIKAGLKSL